MFYNREKNKVEIENLFRDQSVFLVGSGKSLTPLHVQRLKERGVMTFAVNDAGHFVRPNFWLAVDKVCKYPKNIFLDPTIMKFVPISKIGKKLYDEVTDDISDITCYDCPNIFYFKPLHPRDTPENPDFFHKEKVLHGMYGKSSVNVMLPVTRVIYELGFKNVYTIGVDFFDYKSTKASYFFNSIVTRVSVKNIEMVMDQVKFAIDSMKPKGVNWYNCSTLSEFKFIPYHDFDEAVDSCRIKVPYDVSEQRIWFRKYKGKLDLESFEKSIKKGIELTKNEKKHYNRLKKLKKIEENDIS